MPPDTRSRFWDHYPNKKTATRDSKSPAAVMIVSPTAIVKENRIRKIHQYRGGSFRAWLLKIVTNLAYSEMRTWRHNTFQMLEPIDQEGEVNESPRWIKDPRSVPEEEVEANDFRQILESAFDRLSYNYRTPLLLIDVQELNYMEAASIMGVPIGTLKSRLARGRIQFRRILNEMDTIDNSKHTPATRSMSASLPSQLKHRIRHI